MGIIWRFKMVLLSTLAALVIIVNSAEEDYEAQYRKELRPRTLDTGTPRSYEQPWRTMEVEPPIHPSTLEDTLIDNSTEEPIRRRRLGRKRKRQPELSAMQEEFPREIFGFPEEPVRSYAELDFSAERKMTETPKRRRKKLELRPSRWDPPVDEDRPIKRRGQRRKRPNSENWPEFNDFGEYRSGGPADVTQIDTVGSNDDFRHFDDHDVSPIKSPENFQLTLAEETGLTPSRPNYEVFENAPDFNKHEEVYSLIDNKRRDDPEKRPVANDDSKSESEITIEDIASHHVLENDEHIKAREKVRDTQIKYAHEAAKAKDRGFVDPLSLKDILKRSNGTSLSEILQQHNLSLTDLLHGKDQVLSILKSAESFETSTSSSTPAIDTYNMPERNPIDIEEFKEDKLIPNYETRDLIDIVTENPATIQTTEFDIANTTKVGDLIPTTENSKVEESSKRPTIRRFPSSIRRKQRIRPVFNNTLKSQISRDMLALNARKYFNNRRRNTSQEWRDLIPMMKKNITNEDNNKNKKTEIEPTTVTIATEETTTPLDLENCTTYEPETENNKLSEVDDINLNIDPNNTSNIVKIVEDLESAIYKNEKSTSTTTKPTTETINTSGLRRQAFNNRLKKKRLRQKNLTTEPPQDDIMMNLFGIPNLVSSSEFISQTQTPKTSIDDVSMIEDFITEGPRKQENRNKTLRFSPSRSATTSQFVIIPSFKEDSAKVEIEEILNDTKTSARLSKILMERNMTLNELVEHRERGSSHVHLADIFHNASKEPNSPEPFLSKSSIEPISKETYPLRALLDANIHDTTAKATTIDSVLPAMVTTEVSIPVKMDFGNNVNENAENMGIMSLFHNITKKEDNIDRINLMKDSDGTFYETTITVVNTTDAKNGSDTVRESRVIHLENDNNQDDVVSWNNLFTLLRKNYKNGTEDFIEPPLHGIQAVEKNAKSVEDVDGDGLIALEDLQHLKDFDSNFDAAFRENLDLNFNNFMEKTEGPKTNILDKIPSHTKSVTIATASIAGLAMVMFLLTYVGYRWHQQRTLVRKKSFSNERVPTPVFENRKGHKNNSSSRSISPMLSTSNIYTLNTLDSRNGKESPDYMWDSLRKPFQ